MKSLPSLALFATFIGSITLAIAAPTGHLAYFKGKKSIVSQASTGQEAILPGTREANVLSISSSGEVVSFAMRPGQKVDPDGVPPLSDGMLWRAPYKTARALPNLAGVSIYNLYWNPKGSALYLSLSGGNASGIYSLATHRLQTVKALPQSESRDGRLLAYADDETVRVRDAATGSERVVFSIKNPQPVFDALKQGKEQRALKDLSGQIDPQLWKDPSNWRLSAAALEPGGKRLYFSCNAGTSAGAAGNTTWALFACDIATGKIAVLSKTGAFFSRPPDILAVSPDSKRLLIESSTHSSAIENPSSLFIVDLLTQNSRELLLKQAPKGDDANLASGACWSPDGKYIAFSATFYSVEAMEKNPDADWEPKPDSWRLFIADATTGKVVRVIRGATMPSWGR